MAALLDLKAKLLLLAADIEDDLAELSCLADIDQWYAIRTALDAFASTSILSYSIGGRSVTRSDRAQLQRQERELYVRIMNALGGRGSQVTVDLRGTQYGEYGAFGS